MADKVLPKLKYPASILTKVIMENSKTPEENRTVLAMLLGRLDLAASDWSHKLSPESKYISFTFTVLVPAQELLYTMHHDLKKEPGVKFVV